MGDESYDDHGGQENMRSGISAEPRVFVFGHAIAKNVPFLSSYVMEEVESSIYQCLS